MQKKILIIDDDKDLTASLKQTFAMNGYDVALAHSGSEGLKALQSYEPDCIILDVMMETDTAGFEVASQIRSKRETSKLLKYRSIPIIMLTAINQVTNSRFSLDESENFLPDINEFLTKPINLDELLETVERTLNK